jgi:methionyl aminopeptidase
MVLAKGAYPSPLGYSLFPRSCTTSVNNVIARKHRQYVCEEDLLIVVDGIPDE